MISHDSTPGGDTVFLAGILIDGTGAPPREAQAVVVRDGRIEAVVPRSDLTRTHRQGAAVADLGAAALLPGLIDTHAHLTFNGGADHAAVRTAVEQESDVRLALRALGNAQAHLAGGVTTVRDVGGRGFVTLAVRDALRDGLAPGPRVQAAGPAITTPRGHLNYLGAIAVTAAEMRQRATEVLDAGADLVKLCATGGIMTHESDPMGSQYTEEELRAAVEVAESRGTLVAAHVLAFEGLERCVRAGVRSIEHCLWQDAPGEYRFRPEVAAAMREKGITAGITFAGIGQSRYREEVLGRPTGQDMGAWRARLAGRYETEREMIASGVRYVLHSDAGVRETPFGEFWMVLAAACYELRISPVEAIAATTSSAARLMGLEEQVGTIAPGRRADLLVVDGNPAERIEALAAPRLVLRDGRPLAGRWPPAAE